MCYYNAIKIKANEIIQLKNLGQKVLQTDLFCPVQSGFDYPQWPVIVAAGNLSWEIKMMEWGFIPPYLKNRAEVKKMRDGYKMDNGKFKPPLIILNAIGEEILQVKKMFRQAALMRRCLVLSSGFYEWRHVYPLGKKGLPLKTSLKYPYHIKIKDTSCFFMAGIWQSWTDKDSGEMVDSFAIVTTAANSIMEKIHNSKKRMPVILPEPLAAEWISDTLDENRIRELAVYQLDSSIMEAYTVAKNFREETDPMRPCNYPELPELVI
ncbi:MAG: SOS response-associated peptidase [Bacteroidetes bacterium]|nr:SOS response-associated peptidase [Bacteroidota bacterium]